MKKENGFTLLELAISTVIFGMLFVSIIAIYKPYVAHKRIENTENRLTEIYAAVEAYKVDNGFYPCPSSLSANRGSIEYGFATDCAVTTVAEGACEAGNAYCVRQSSRPLVNSRVRIGAVPFRELNISEQTSYDGYKSRFYYVMTESLAIDTTNYSPDNGGIEVLDIRGETLTGDTPSSAKYIIFSVGENQVGGYNLEGAEVVACAPPYTGADLQNCRQTLNASFVSTGYAGEGTGNEMDDFIMFENEQLNQTLAGWRVGSEGNPNENPDDILTNRSVKIGDFEASARASLDVSGTLNDMRAEGVLVAEDSLCDFDATGSATGCFKVAQLERTCPSGEYVTGIGYDEGVVGDPTDDSNILCSPIGFQCADKEMIVGVDSSGVPLCAPIPAPGTTFTFDPQTTTDTVSIIGTVVNGVNKVVGTIGDNGNIIDSTGKVIGTLGNGGTILDVSGKVIGSIGSGTTLYNGQGKVIGTVNSQGSIANLSGQTIGSIGANGVITNTQGQVVGTVGSLYTTLYSTGTGTQSTNTVGTGGKLIGSGGVVLGTIGKGGVVLGSNGQAIGTVGVGSTVTNGGGQVIGTVGSNGTVVNGGGQVIGSIGSGGTVVNPGGQTIGSVTGVVTVTTQTVTKPSSCSQVLDVKQVQCPSSSTTYYDEYQMLICPSGTWVAQGNNKKSACCSLSPNPVTTTSSTSSPGSPSWVCGSYGSGTRTITKYPDLNSCTLGNPNNSYSCTCLPPGVDKENPPGYDPAIHDIMACATRQYTYPKNGAGTCTSRVPSGTLLTSGSLAPASFAWSLNGASPDNIDYVSSNTIKEGDSCSDPTQVKRCATKDPVQGGKHQYYVGCTCKKLSNGSAVKCP